MATTPASLHISVYLSKLLHNAGDDRAYRRERGPARTGPGSATAGLEGSRASDSTPAGISEGYPRAPRASPRTGNDNRGPAPSPSSPGARRATVPPGDQEP